MDAPDNSKVLNLAANQLFQKGATEVFGFFVVVKPAQELLLVVRIIIGELLDEDL